MKYEMSCHESVHLSLIGTFTLRRILPEFFDEN